MCGAQSKAQLAVGTVPSQRSVESFTLRVSHKERSLRGGTILAMGKKEKKPQTALYEDSEVITRPGLWSTDRS